MSNHDPYSNFKSAAPGQLIPQVPWYRSMWALATCYTYDVARVNMVASYFFWDMTQSRLVQPESRPNAHVANVNTLDIMRGGKCVDGSLITTET